MYHWGVILHLQNYNTGFFYFFINEDFVLFIYWRWFLSSTNSLLVKELFFMCKFLLNYFDRVIMVVFEIMMTPWKMFMIVFTQRILKPNSWTYTFNKVSGHNHGSSQTWGVLNHMEGG